MYEDLENAVDDYFNEDVDDPLEQFRDGFMAGISPKWTREWPTKPGYYHVIGVLKTQSDYDVNIISVEEHNGILSYFVDGAFYHKRNANICFAKVPDVMVNMEIIDTLLSTSKEFENA